MTLTSLAGASARGDARAYRELLAALVPLLSRFFARRMNDRSEIDDLVQDTLIAIHKRFDSYDAARPFAPWLFAVARHKLIDHFRRKRPQSSLADLAEIAEETMFDDAVTARLDVDAALGALSDKQARSIRLTRIEGLSVADAASAQGLSESDVKVSVHRGLKALMRRFEAK